MRHMYDAAYRERVRIDFALSIRRAFSRNARVFLALSMFLILGNTARADLVLALSPATLAANPGDTVTFKGQITNITGVTLNASDMFLNFSGFDPAALINFTQLLGTPDFVLLDHHISPIIDLFSVTVAPAAPPGAHAFEVSLQDINNDSSNTVMAVAGGVTGPEPSSVLLFITGIGGVILLAGNERRRKRQRS